MKRKMLFCFILFLLVCKSSFFQVNAAQPTLKLWYKQPAVNWMTSALPIGNGSLGGMFFGGTLTEQIQFNEKTLWSGSTTSRGAYQNFGDLFFTFPSGHAIYTDYNRELSLDEAIGRVTYKSDGVTYLREYFASNPDSAIVMRITTPGQTGKLSFSVGLTDAHTGIKSIVGNKITISGVLNLLSYEGQVVVINEGGSITTGTSQISITNADAATVILTGATNFNPVTTSYITETATSLHARMTARITKASAKSYDLLKVAHLGDYKPIFNRVKLDFNAQMPNVPTDELIRSYKTNPYLDILYFQYGRYLMLGSSRGLALPSNLQGIWNNTNSPAWQCDIHNNINVQMNYWPAETTNLAECHLPYLDYIFNESIKIGGSWQKMATSLGCRGWAIKTQNNIFGYSDWNWNRPANAWLCMDLWQHYIYTKDDAFLANKAFPAMKSACEFWFDRLTMDSKGKWEAPDEWSPEQGPWKNGTAYSQQLIWELFTQTLKAAKILNANSTFITQLTDKLTNLDNGVNIGTWGEIREWKDSSDVKGNQHRHISHLIALYPGNQISYRLDSAYANAAKTSLLSRGDGGTGWSRSWKISCWARLFDGNHAYTLLKAAQNLTTVTVISMVDGTGGVYENLLDAHPSYQIDGNFGATAGIAEMLLQSNLGSIHILPALPSIWANGSYSGLKAMNNFTVDLSWKNSLPVQAKVYSGSGDTCKVYYPSQVISSIIDESGTNINFIQKKTSQIEFPTSIGKIYTISFINSANNNSEITPYLKVDNATKVQSNNVDLIKGQTLLLTPESAIAGTWTWTGPNNFTSTQREVILSTLTVNISGNYIVTHTVNGLKSIIIYSITVTDPNPVYSNIIPAGDYYVNKKGTNLYWTNTQVTLTGTNPGGKPKFLTKGSGLSDQAQVWTFSMDASRYKIVSKADGRYVNESGKFGTNAYSANWNTFNIFSNTLNDTINFAVQNSGNATANLWQIDANQEVIPTTTTMFDSNTNIVFSLFPWKINTGTYIVPDTKPLIWSTIGKINVKSNKAAVIYIYDQMGNLLKQTKTNGDITIQSSIGFYIVKIKNADVTFIDKIIVRY